MYTTVCDLELFSGELLENRNQELLNSGVAYNILECSSLRIQCWVNPPFIHSIDSCVEGHLGCFHFLTIENNAVVITGAQMLLRDCECSSLTYTPRSGIADSYGRSTVAFLRNFHAVFSGAAPFYIPTNYTWVLVSLYPCRYLSASVSVTAILTGVKQYIIVVLMVVSLMVSDVDHLSYTCWLFVCLLWRNFHSSTSSIFKVGYLFLCFWAVGVPHVF